MKNKIKYIINADDFGLSKGVNDAVLKMFLSKKLNSTSIFVTTKYTQEAIEIAKNNPDLKIGLHFTLTTGKAISPKKHLTILTDKNNYFHYGFIGLLFILMISKKARLEAEQELIAQVEFLEQNGIQIDHINGHRHIHFLPILFPICLKILNSFRIPNIRIINEDFFLTFKIGEKISLLGFVKFVLLKFFYYINDAKKYHNNRYFFSILHTCNINEKLINKIQAPDTFSEIEIMIHPSNIKLDSNLDSDDFYGEKTHLLSQNRSKEFFL